MSLPRTFSQADLDSVQGWLSPQAQTLTEHLVNLQNKAQQTTGVLEFGVFKGKYLALLAQIAKPGQVPVVGVDAFLERAGVKLIPEYRESAEREIHASVELVTKKKSSAILIGGYTREIETSDISRHCPGGYSFISVDAGHDAEDLLVDCPKIEELISEHGVAAFDDVFNPVTPGVGEGFFRYYISQSSPVLVPFATGGNKVFMCRPDHYQRYYDFCVELALSAAKAVPELAGSTAQVEGNAFNEWTPRLFGKAIVPFL